MAIVPIYLDYNATTPVDPEVLEAMLPFFQNRFGNAASTTHAFGWFAEDAVKQARHITSEMLGCAPQELVFTSGATESINLALRGVADMYARKGDHIITLGAEHKAVLDTCKALERQGKRVTYLEVEPDGRLSLEVLEAAMTKETILVSVMLANNETGVLQDLPAIAEIVHAHDSILMTDATQAVGKIPVSVEELGVDLLTLSAHKCYGPKGVGALYVRRRNPRVRLQEQIAGGGHERGMRSGTLNVPGIVGLGKALEICGDKMETESIRLGKLRNQLETGLSEIELAAVNGNREHRLSHVTNMSFPFIDSEGLITAMRQLAVATGSACTSALMEPSHVLRAMGLSEEMAHAAIRFSLGRFTTEREIIDAIGIVQSAVSKLRQLNLAWKMRT